MNNDRISQQEDNLMHQQNCKQQTPTERLRSAGLRPTRQRVELARLIFDKGDRHLTAEELHDDAIAHGVSCSLATIYNTLHQFTDAGMLRVLSVDSSKTFFDTNISNHYHFIMEGSDEVVDIDPRAIDVTGLPEAPEGMEIANVDVIVRLRPIQA